MGHEPKPLPDGVTTMALEQLINDGWLQEVNRQFFHPHGLALAVDPDEGTIQVWDDRADLEGWRFATMDDAESHRKAELVTASRTERGDARIEKLGYWVQPVGDRGDER